VPARQCLQYEEQVRKGFYLGFFNQCHLEPSHVYPSNLCRAVFKL